MGKSRKHKTWEDLYYDGKIEIEQGFCEDTQEIVELSVEDGWDDIEVAANELYLGIE